MRRLSIAFFLTTSFLVGGVFVACGGDTVTATDGGDDGGIDDPAPSTSSSTGTNQLPDGGDSTPGQPPKSDSGANATDDGGPPPPPEFPVGDIEVPPGTCTAILNESTAVTVGGDGSDASEAKGGTLVDGTYLLTSAKAAFPQELIDVVFPNDKPTVQATLHVAGGNIEFVTDAAFGAQAYHGEMAATVASAGKSLDGNQTCPEPGAVSLPYTAKADGTFRTWLAYQYQAYNVKVEVTLTKKAE